MQLTTQQEHYLTMLGSCWESARLARIRVRLELDDGEVVTAVPDDPAFTADDQAIDSTGLAPLMLLGGRVVDPLSVQNYSVVRPD